LTAPSRPSQAIFERYLAGELSLTEAADALTALIRARKAAGADLSDLPLRRPAGAQLSAAGLARAQTLFEEMNRRSGAA
jgi:hypothetical protein